MRFAGQVRIPEVDHPGVPAVFLIEDGQAEVLLEGESLGRWSLFDVHASRLVSSAFSVKLGDEEITFVADEPMDFAYKGVEEMAAEWARYKTMTIPRRMVAVKLSRRGTEPSRIEELREVMLQNLEVVAARPAPTMPAPQPESVPVKPPPGVAAAEAGSSVAGSPVRHESAPPPPFAPALEPDSETAPLESSRPRLIPGPGLAARRDHATPDGDVVAPEPSPTAGSHERPAEAREAESAEPPSEERRVAESEFAEPMHTEPSVEERAPVEPVAPPPRADEGTTGDERFGPSEPEVADEPVAAAVAPNGDPAPTPLVVDLGQFEDRGPAVGAVPPSPPDGVVDHDGVLVGAASEKAGLLGAVRAAFVRNKEPHQHEFVEAPGGIGITRRICAECGHISIGTTD